jgi:hypothetical protein
VRGKAEEGVVEKDYRVRLDQGLGREYRPVDEHAEIAPTAPEHTGLDPDLGGRGLRAHNVTQNLVASAVEGFRELPGPLASQVEFLQRPPVPLGFQLERPALRRSCSGSQSSKVATIGLWSLKAYHPVGLNATHRRSLSAREPGRRAPRARVA